MSDTATIRVSTETRDTLAKLAHDDHLSLSAFLARLSRQQRRTRILAAEREAVRQDAGNPAAVAEYMLWEETGNDGVE